MSKSHDPRTGRAAVLVTAADTLEHVFAACMEGRGYTVK